MQIVRDLGAADVHIDDIALRRPTLDDVFLSLTGHAAEGEESGSQDPKAAIATGSAA
jgi:ABC-2 type transport system ATP-binding protein